MAMAKKCDRCGKLYEHYPKGNKAQSNAIRKIQRDALGGTVNAYSEWVMDLCPECMNEFEKFMTAKIVEDGSTVHPGKTRQSLFLEQYPEARMGDDGVLHVDPCAISASHRNAHGSCATMKRECKDCRREFWMHKV